MRVIFRKVFILQEPGCREKVAAPVNSLFNNPP
jgi:hypothetical protein